jgi:hypothetical protein
MLKVYSIKVHRDVVTSVAKAIERDGIVRICTLAEEVRVRNLDANIALEDIEVMVLREARHRQAPMEIEGMTTIVPPLFNGHDHAGILEAPVA